MQNAWLRDLELSWSLRCGKEPRTDQTISSSNYVPKLKPTKKKTKKSKDTQYAYPTEERSPTPDQSGKKDRSDNQNNKQSYERGYEASRPGVILTNNSTVESKNQQSPTTRKNTRQSKSENNIKSSKSNSPQKSENESKVRNLKYEEIIKPYQFESSPEQVVTTHIVVKECKQKTEWDDRFIFGEPLKQSEHENLLQNAENGNKKGFNHYELRDEMHRRTTAPSANIASTLPMSSLESPVINRKAVSQPIESSEPFFQSEVEDSVYNKETKKMEKATSEELIAEAEKLWTKMITELRESGLGIQYVDLVEVSSLVRPPHCVEPIITYIGVLLGIKPGWEAARRSLFKQLYPLLKFLREVDPASIPHRRLRKAVKLREGELYALTVESVARSHRAASLLMRWVLAFNSLARLILSAEKRRKELAKNSCSRDLGTLFQFEDSAALRSSFFDDVEVRGGSDIKGLEESFLYPFHQKIVGNDDTDYLALNSDRSDNGYDADLYFGNEQPMLPEREGSRSGKTALAGGSMKQSPRGQPVSERREDHNEVRFPEEAPASSSSELPVEAAVQYESNDAAQDSNNRKDGNCLQNNASTEDTTESTISGNKDD